MRIFAHHRFRESVEIYLNQHGSLDGWKPQDLKEKPSDWLPQHYKAGSEHDLKRQYFAA